MAYRFGPFQLDPRSGTLNGPEGPVRLRRQAFRLAEVLLARAPELLDHDTLLDEVWGRTALSANALTQTISELRHALGDDAHHPRYIQTVHRRGYRVVCRVERVAPDSGGAPMRPATPSRNATASGGRVRTGVTLLAVTLLLASASSPPTGSDRSWHPEGPPLALLRMCARLPEAPGSAVPSSHGGLPETLALHPTGMRVEDLQTCLPAR